MGWAGIALLGLHLIIEKWPGCIRPYGWRWPVSCWTGSDAARRAEKEAVSRLRRQVELAKSGCSFLKGLLTNLANPKAIIDFGRRSHRSSVITLALPRAGIFVRSSSKRWRGLPSLPACRPAPDAPWLSTSASGLMVLPGVICRICHLFDYLR
ncbi:LysE family transporter [Shigella flexneri]